MRKNNTPLSYALFLLGRRDYAQSEISEKLRKRYNQEEAEQCLKVLIEKKFLDDRRFVRSYLGSHQKKGKAYLRQKLNLFKIDSDLVEEEMANISEDDEFEKAKDQVEKFLSRRKSQDNLYQKAGGFLARQGFSYDIIKKVLQNILNENQ